ncbi:MAG: tetratricopeptide repeat protein, partial [Steroidobacteraceae bacterium]
MFFGRSEALGDLIRRIREIESAAESAPKARLLLVQGMSGSGKTSLFKAGLLPLLGLRPIEGIAQWCTIILKPSESEPELRNFGPIGVMASRLGERVPTIERLGMPVHKLAEMLNERPREATARIETCLAAEAEKLGLKSQHIRLLIYIDQLEETFALPDWVDATAPLLAALVALAQSELIWVAATLRSDFAHRLEGYPELMACLTHAPPYSVMPPRPDELAQMIREPAQAAGLLWEQREGVSLDQELLRDATGNPEALPLLEYTLSELYERREGRLLRWSEYGGGLKGTLITAAEEVLKGAAGDVDTTFRDVMRELVGVGVDGAATRRYAPLARFPEASAKRALLDRLVARRLCVTTDEGRGDGPVTSLAHEALIRSWPRAQLWLEREDSLLRMRDELSRDAAAWETHGRSDGWLGIAPEKLAAIAQVDGAGLAPTGPAAEYSQRSRARAQRNAWIRRSAVGVIAMLAIVAAAAWVTAFRQRNVAVAEANTANRTTQFMVSLFEMADPEQNRGKNLSVRELLDKGAGEITKSDAGNAISREPAIRAELLTAMGQAYTGLGLYEPAKSLLDLALIDDAAGAVTSEARVRTLTADGTALFLDGKYMEAVKPLEDAVNLARRTLDPSNAVRTQALTADADNLVQLGDFDRAIQLCTEALREDRKRGTEDAPILANTLDSLGAAYLSSGDPFKAEAPFREALQIREKALGVRHARTVQSMNDLGADLYMAGRYDEAMAQYQMALPVMREIYGDEHPAVATLLNNIGRSALMAGHVDEAEPLLRQALIMTEKFEGMNHDDLIMPLNSLAMIDAFRGNIDTALQEIKRAEALARMPDQGELLDQVLINKASFDLVRGDLGD